MYRPHNDIVLTRNPLDTTKLPKSFRLIAFDYPWPNVRPQLPLTTKSARNLPLPQGEPAPRNHPLALPPPAYLGRIPPCRHALCQISESTSTVWAIGKFGRLAVRSTLSAFPRFGTGLRGFFGGWHGLTWRPNRTSARHACMWVCVCVRASCATPFLLNFRSRCNNYYFLVDFAADVVLAFFCFCCAVSRTLSFAHLWRPSCSHLCLRRGAHAWRMHLLSHVGVRMSGCAFPACFSVCVCAPVMLLQQLRLQQSTGWGLPLAGHLSAPDPRKSYTSCCRPPPALWLRIRAGFWTMDGGVCGSTPEKSPQRGSGS